jgi:non-ribosomal peptide synthetase component F
MTLSFSIKYWAPTFADSQIQGIASTFMLALSDIIKNPNRNVSELTLCSDRDLNQILDWNKEMPLLVDVCIHDMISQRFQEQPDAPAICAWDGNLTYKELDALSSQLAVYLMSIGVGPEIFVPICLEKSKFTTVAILGIMKVSLPAITVLVRKSFEEAFSC